MSLVINAPAVEHKLKEEAHKQGISTEQYAVAILSSHVGADLSLPQASTLPFYATASTEEWLKRFDEWVDSHPKREPLPDSALERESFYEA